MGSETHERRYQTKNVRRPTEYNITNALQRLVRKGERWVVFVAGHGERSPHGKANHDYGDFGRELERKGFLLQQVNVAARESFPDNTALVVIAGAQVDSKAAQAVVIARWVQRGVFVPAHSAIREPALEQHGKVCESIRPDRGEVDPPSHRSAPCSSVGGLGCRRRRGRLYYRDLHDRFLPERPLAFQARAVAFSGPR